MLPSGDPATMLKSALAYAGKWRWPVFPCIGKVPAIRGGRGCLDATLDSELIRRWWERQYPGANIGLAAGHVAGWWALDVDGDEGEETLANLTRANGELPQTPEQFTGGGRHLLFRFTDGTIRNAVRFAPGLDVRSTGGYIVASPSVHPRTGRRYAWSVDAHPSDTELAPAPRWLLALLRSMAPSAKVENVAQHPVIDHPPWLDLACNNVPVGRRNDTLARLAGHLLRRCDPLLAVTLAHDWNYRHCTPPLSDAEVNRTVESIASLELRRIRGSDG